jgi:lipopolysaccharide/colanic/teichoic acid biosynthesis glycosyltransferase
MSPRLVLNWKMMFEAMLKLSRFNRLIDIAGSAIILVVLSPLLVVVAALVKLASPSDPVFCAPIRRKPDGSCYRRIKFCPRRGWLGEFLHRYSVDELPVFIRHLGIDIDKKLSID